MKEVSCLMVLNLCFVGTLFHLIDVFFTQKKCVFRSTDKIRFVELLIKPLLS